MWELRATAISFGNTAEELDYCSSVGTTGSGSDYLVRCISYSGTATALNNATKDSFGDFDTNSSLSSDAESDNFLGETDLDNYYSS